MSQANVKRRVINEKDAECDSDDSDSVICLGTNIELSATTTNAACSVSSKPRQRRSHLAPPLETIVTTTPIHNTAPPVTPSAVIPRATATVAVVPHKNLKSDTKLSPHHQKQLELLHPKKKQSLPQPKMSMTLEQKPKTVVASSSASRKKTEDHLRKDDSKKSGIDKMMSNLYSSKDVWCWRCYVPLQDGYHVLYEHPHLQVVSCYCCKEDLTTAVSPNTTPEDKDMDECAGCGMEDEVVLFLCSNDACSKGFCYDCIVQAHGGDKATVSAMNLEANDVEWRCLSCEPPHQLRAWQEQYHKLAMTEEGIDDDIDDVSTLSEVQVQAKCDALVTQLVACEQELTRVLGEFDDLSIDGKRNSQEPKKNLGEESDDDVERRGSLERHHECVRDKIAALQEELETACHVDLSELYKRVFKFELPSAEDDEKKPPYVLAADRAVDERIKREKSERHRIVLPFASVEDTLHDQYVDVEELEEEGSSGVDALTNTAVAGNLGWSDGIRVPQECIQKLREIENVKLAMDNIPVQIVTEKLDKLETRQEQREEKQSRRSGRRRRGNTLQRKAPAVPQPARVVAAVATTSEEPQPSQDLDSQDLDVSDHDESSPTPNGRVGRKKKKNKGPFYRSTLVLNPDDKSLRSVKLATNIVKQLKQHQKEGLHFIWRNSFSDLNRNETGNEDDEGVGGCIIAHCMGLGKSLTAIALLYSIMNHPSLRTSNGIHLFRFPMIIAPVNTLQNWEAEILKWTKNLNPQLMVYNLANIEKSARKQSIFRWRKRGGILLLGEQLFRNLVKDPENTGKSMSKILQPDVLILDEAHTMLKNSANAIYKALLCIKTKRRILLTGTPLQNNVSEYFNMVQFARPGAIDGIQSESQFEKVYRIPIEKGLPTDVPLEVMEESVQKQNRLKTCLEPIVHRVDASVLRQELPHMQQAVLHLRPSRVQTKLYDRYKKLQKVDPQKKNFFRMWKDLKKVHNHPGVLLMPVPSLNRVNRPRSPTLDEDEDCEADDSKWWESGSKNTEEFKEIESGFKLVLLLHILAFAHQHGEKVLVFSSCLRSLDFIENVLAKPDWSSLVPSLREFPQIGGYERDKEFVRIDGSIASGERGDLVTKFNDDTPGTARVFLISSRAGGHGINLPAANRVVLFDSEFNPAISTQCVYRAYRYGQTKEVFCYRLLTEGTMEEKIYARSVNKNGVSLRVVDGKSINRCFSSQELTAIQESLTWVQCDSCEKWRVLPKTDVDVEALEHWTCSMNDSDPLNKSCEDPERNQKWYEEQYPIDEVSTAPGTGSPMKYMAAEATESDLTDEAKNHLLEKDELLQHLVGIKQNKKKKAAMISRFYFHEALFEPIVEQPAAPAVLERNPTVTDPPAAKKPGDCSPRKPHDGKLAKGTKATPQHDTPIKDSKRPSVASKLKDPPLRQVNDSIVSKKNVATNGNSKPQTPTQKKSESPSTRLRVTPSRQAKQPKILPGQQTLNFSPKKKLCLHLGDELNPKLLSKRPETEPPRSVAENTSSSGSQSNKRLRPDVERSMSSDDVHVQADAVGSLKENKTSETGLAVDGGRPKKRQREISRKPQIAKRSATDEVINLCDSD